MASMTSFKLPCPSCDARILIKDHSMVGRKIDCPKCKYRFVVTEPPPPPEEEESVAETAGSKRITAGANRTPADPPLEIAAAKPDTKRTRLKDALREAEKQEQPDASNEPEKKKRRLFANPSLTLKIGIGLGVAAVFALLAALGVMMFGGNKDQAKSPPKRPSVVKNNSPSGPSGPSETSTLTGTSGSSNAANPASSRDKPAGSTPIIQPIPVVNPDLYHPERELYAWLPNETDTVFSAARYARNLDDGEPAGDALFRTTGGFMREWVEKNLGFRLVAIREMLRAEGGPADRRWALTFFRMDKRMDPPQFVKGMGTPGSQVREMRTSKGQPYYLFQPNLLVDGLGDVLLGSAAGHTAANAAQPDGGMLAFYAFGDLQTAVVGDRDRLVKLLEDGRPQLYTTWQSGGQGHADEPKGSGTPQDPKQPEKASGSAAARAKGSASKSSGSGSRPAFEPYKGPAFGTVAPSFQELSALLEKGGHRSLALAATIRPDHELLRRVDRILNTELDRMLLGVGPVPEGLKGIGLALLRLEEQPGPPDIRGVTWSAALNYEPGSPFTTPAVLNLRGVQTPELINRFKHQFGLHVVDRQTLAQDLMKEDSEKGSGSASKGSTGSGAKPGAGSGSGQPDAPTSTIGTGVADDHCVIWHIDLNWPTLVAGKPTQATTALLDFLRAAVVHTKCSMEMMDARDPLIELGQAVANYVAAKQKSANASEHAFPRGALKRNGRSETDPHWLIRDRLSWMVELLPHLPDSDLQQFLQTDAGKKLWDGRHNLSPAEGELGALGQVLVPQFLVDRATTENAWWIARPGKSPLAATHIVGIAGVGLDIARETDMAKPGVGIFGFERETRFDQIKGGLGNTILMIQIPVDLPADRRKPEYGPIHPTPWLLAGGTVRGVPETQSLDPFLCTTRNGKVGTHIIMADGTVRFLAKGALNDDQFKALCTLGGNKPTLDDNNAPIVWSPAQAEPPKGSASATK